MTFDKECIRSNFDAAAGSYDDVAHVQAQAAALLSHMIQQQIARAPATILDLGTGTGYMPLHLAEYYPHSRYILNDISPAMLRTTEQKMPAALIFQTLLGDMESIVLPNAELITANLVFQWLDCLEPFLRRLLQQCDYCAFSMLLQGTFAEWGVRFMQQQLPSPVPNYLGDEELLAALNALDAKLLSYKIVELPLSQDNERQFMRYLKALGANTSVHRYSSEDLQKVMNHGSSSQLRTTYRIFFAVMRR